MELNINFLALSLVMSNLVQMLSHKIMRPPTSH